MPTGTENTKTELIVQQSDLDMLLGFPVFGQIENIESLSSEILLELKKQNDYMIPTPEEQKELQALELEQNEFSTMQAVEEQPADEPTTEEPTEPEIIIDYDPLVLEQLEILNAHMEVSQELQQKQTEVTSETALILVVTVIVVIALKVFVEQITKW